MEPLKAATQFALLLASITLVLLAVGLAFSGPHSRSHIRCELPNGSVCKEG